MSDKYDLVISQVKHLKELLAASENVSDKERVEITLDILQEIEDGKYHDPRKSSCEGFWLGTDKEGIMPITASLGDLINMAKETPISKVAQYAIDNNIKYPVDEDEARQINKLFDDAIDRIENDPDCMKGIEKLL